MKDLMKTIFNFIFLVIAVFLLLNLHVEYSVQAADDNRLKILIVHSYHKEMPWVQEYTKGIMETLEAAQTDHAFSIRHFYMDTKKKPEKCAAMAARAYEIFRKFKPRLVIACDDNAQKYFVVPYLMNKTAVPVVFLGVNQDPEAYGYPAANVTGVLERNHIVLTMQLLMRLQPSIKRIAVINDASITGMMLTRRIREAMSRTNLKVTGYYNTNSFEEWKRLISEAQTSTDAIYFITYYTLRDRRNKHVPILSALKWLILNNRLPEASNTQDTVKNGALCSIAIDGYMHGRDAAHKALEIVNGKKCVDIPISQTRRGIRVINRSRARYLGISIPSYLIEGTVFHDSPLINSR